MTKSILAGVGAAALALSGCATTMNDDMDDVAYIDGAAMYANQNIVQNAMNSPIHTTLVAAVQQAQLADTLMGAGPFTVFAPTDEAFSRVPASMRSSLMMDENRAALQKVLTYHVVPGRVTASDLAQRIRAGGGTAMVKTVQGEELTFHMRDGNVMVMGKNGSSAYVTQTDVMQSNGVIHVVNGVLTPSM